MDRRTTTQLDKILAMADSAHDGEAIVALRKARQMLARDGLNFSDLARAAVTTTFNPATVSAQRRKSARSFLLFSNQHSYLESQIAEMRQNMDELQVELANQGLVTETWRRRAIELEQQLNLSLTQSTRWRALAQETVDKLWDLGQSMRIDDAASTTKALSQVSDASAKTLPESCETQKTA